ncbi:ZYRO0B08580p [Zygosaccharomyces rouxii]|uniref:ZYRO0B08580p n=1 Tax=Zygosaccharomyces rouxii (strain ATCC 2623 / CBS 732 / NBRC 1130 / NCYC 568 / NRRL Y-229) TaxID=559307 RepID=C5DRH9_ZYGRC|nr:uncharacterized protein ZYRO0B08580g [Zygosaccharomyces rouxii]KAH9200072.1 hypothetical protein LQ764DRAFT_112076 [Zygosaccharomyces rouxii]CAR26390.1 ZYRO0B08580p [Zygosaccharomyces rouxii]
MNGSPVNQDLLEVYINTIEQQIDNKKFFVKQARDAIGSLQTGGMDVHSISSEQWQNFMKRPMFFPERSDPIGLGLASTGFVSRQQSSEQWLEHMEVQLNDMQTMIRNQQQMNHEMTVLLELLLHKLETPSEDNTIQETPVQRNHTLRNELKNFIRDFLSLDLADSQNTAEQVCSDVMVVIERLINYDTNLTTTDFPPSTKGLFRLLLRGNLITLNEVGDKRYVKLTDFASTEVV